MQATVYIVRCSNGSNYTGLTRQDVEARLLEHNRDPIDGYTARRRPVELVFAEVFDRITEAIARERQIKGWGRAKKEALIRGDYEALPALSSRPSRLSHPSHGEARARRASSRGGEKAPQDEG